MYTPKFKCQYCGETREPYTDNIFGDVTPFVDECHCDASRKEREQNYRIEMERRKKQREIR